MRIQWNYPFLAPSHSSPDLDANNHNRDSLPQAESLSTLLRSSSRKDPCNRLYRKAALLPDSTTPAAAAQPPPQALSRTLSDSGTYYTGRAALQYKNLDNELLPPLDMTYPPAAPYRRDAEGRASRSANNLNAVNGANGANGGPLKNANGMPHHEGQNGRYVNYDDISDDDDDLRSPPPAVQDAVHHTRQTQQRLSGAAVSPEHWVPAANHPNAGPHSGPSGGVRGAPGSGNGQVRSRPPSYSGGRPDELAVSGPSSSQHNNNSSRQPQRTGPANGGGNKRPQNRSPPRGAPSSQQPSSTHNGGPPPAMLNVSNHVPARLPTPSVAASVLKPLEQKVTEYSALMREAEDQVDQLDDEIRALQERRAAAESRYMEAKARHDEYRSQHADVERALRGDLPPLTPMLPPLPQSQPGSIGMMSGGANGQQRVGNPQQQPQQQQQQRMQNRGSMGSLHDQYHYENERTPQENINSMNRRQTFDQGNNRPMSSSSAGDSLRHGQSYVENGKKKSKFRSLFG